MQKLILPLMISTSVVVAPPCRLCGSGPFNTKSQGVMNIAVFGDAPYGTAPADPSEFEAPRATIVGARLSRYHIDATNGRMLCAIPKPGLNAAVGSTGLSYSG